MLTLLDCQGKQLDRALTALGTVVSRPRITRRWIFRMCPLPNSRCFFWTTVARRPNFRWLAIGQLAARFLASECVHAQR
jgi:hypothetical protein